MREKNPRRKLALWTLEAHFGFCKPLMKEEKFGLLTSATRRPGTKYSSVATTRGHQWGDGDQMADPRWQTNGDAMHGTTTAVFVAPASSRLRASFLPGW